MGYGDYGIDEYDVDDYDADEYDVGIEAFDDDMEPDSDYEFHSLDEDDEDQFDIFAEDESGFDYDFEDDAGTGYSDEPDELFGSRARRRRRRRRRKVFGFARRLAKRLVKVGKKLAPAAGAAIGTLGGPAGTAIGGSVGGIVRDLEDEDFADYEDDDMDTEDEMNATLPIAPVDDSLAEAMAAAAAKSSPNDAQALGGAITITIMTRSPLAVKSMAPGIASATGRIAKSMASSPASRPLVKVMPDVVKRTAASLGRKAAKGKPITNKTTARVMKKQLKRVLGSEKNLAKALAGNEVKRRRLNKAAIARAERFY
jgi:hypothetical protein